MRNFGRNAGFGLLLCLSIVGSWLIFGYLVNDTVANDRTQTLPRSESEHASTDGSANAAVRIDRDAKEAEDRLDDNSSIEGGAPHNEAPRKSILAPTLDALYAKLSDSSEQAQWGQIIRQIAANGRSDASAAVLLAFLRAELPGDIIVPSAKRICINKVDVLILLPYVGGDEAGQVTRDAFLNGTKNLELRWLADAMRTPGIQQLDWWDPLIKGRASIGLLVSGDESDEEMVRTYFWELQGRFGRLAEAEEDFYWILVDSLAIADIAKTQGRGFLLVEGFGDTPVYKGLKIEARKQYLPGANPGISLKQPEGNSSIPEE